jgi:hypothetical protein
LIRLFKNLFVTCYLDPDPHSFSKLDPDPHSLKKLDPDPHKVHADPKQCCRYRCSSGPDTEHCAKNGREILGNEKIAQGS